MSRWTWFALETGASFTVMAALALLGWWKGQPVPMWGYFLGAAVGDLLVNVHRATSTARNVK